MRAWQGPHHSAQKSTTTGTSAERLTTASSNVASVTSTVPRVVAPWNTHDVDRQREVATYARIHRLETTPEQYEEGRAIVTEQLLPWARESTGYRGLIGLVDRENGQSLVLTLWADEEAFERSSQAGDRLSAAAAEASGATRRALESYEVTIFDLPVTSSADMTAPSG